MLWRRNELSYYYFYIIFSLQSTLERYKLAETTNTYTWNYYLKKYYCYQSIDYAHQINKIIIKLKSIQIGFILLTIILIMNTFQITSILDDVYPDIEGELCSKHTVVLNQVQKAFRKTFPMHPPTHYVISKAVIDLAKTSKSTLSMALQQGTIIMFSAGQEGAQLHISGNALEQDLAFEASGKSINSQKQNETAVKIKSMIECATEDLSLNRINGGFLYIYCQNSIQYQQIKNSLLLGVFMSIIAINDLIQQYSQQQLLSKLKSNKYLQSCDIETYFSCKNRQLIVKNQTIVEINLEKKYKFVFLSLDFIDKQFSQINQNQQYQDLLSNFTNGSIDITSFFTNVQNIQKHTVKSDVLQFITKLKQQLKIKSFICCHQYAIFLVQKHRYAELTGKISKSLHQLHQSRHKKQDDGSLTNRFGSQINMSSIVFSSVPSKALSIYDPSNSLWY